MKVGDLLEEFDYFCKEEKRDFLMKLWQSYSSDILEDLFMREIIIKMYSDIMRFQSQPAFTNRNLNNSINIKVVNNANL